MRALGASVLAGEALVVFFALLVAALLPRRWALWAGWAVQVLVVASGFVVPAMFLLGAVFAGLWYAALRLGSTAGGGNGVETVGPPR